MEIDLCIWFGLAATSEINNSVTEVTLALPFQATFKPVLRIFNALNLSSLVKKPPR